MVIILETLRKIFEKTLEHIWKIILNCILLKYEQNTNFVNNRKKWRRKLNFLKILLCTNFYRFLYKFRKTFEKLKKNFGKIPQILKRFLRDCGDILRVVKRHGDILRIVKVRCLKNV